MALVHTVVEIRSYYDTWIAIVDIEDDLSGQLYHFRWNYDEEVTGSSQEVLDDIASAKEDIQAEILLLANDMNLPVDEQKALEYLQDVKRAIILEIRNTPTATLVQAQTYIATNYPDSMIDFMKLYQWYLQLLGLTTWDEFKAFVIASKFREID
jgi:hypothetical protein